MGMFGETLGLSSAEASRRLEASGPNEPASARRASPAREILPSLANPLIVILVAASARSTLNRVAHWNLHHKEWMRLVKSFQTLVVIPNV